MGLMESLGRIRAKNPRLAAQIESRGYCVTQEFLPILSKEFPDMWLLVRCGMGRFKVQAQDCEHFTKIILEHFKLSEHSQDRDYVRDVSIPA